MQKEPHAKAAKHAKDWLGPLLERLAHLSPVGALFSYGPDLSPLASFAPFA